MLPFGLIDNGEQRFICCFR